MKTIAVLLTVHNRKIKTIHCLEHLYNQQNLGGHSFDVYVTVDGCTDGTKEAIETQFPDVKIIEGNGSLYWNRGMMKAWQVAAKSRKYSFFLWLNDDTNLKSHALYTLLNTSALLMHRSIIVGTTISSKNLNYTYGGKKIKKGLIEPNQQIEECDYFNGNIVLIPQYVYNIVGMNDAIFRHALGDFDYGLRAKKAGIKSFVSKGILGTCDEHESLANWCNPKVSFNNRWREFRNPLGHNPEEFFIFEKRHNGLIVAIFHYITNHLRVFFPKIWTSNLYKLFANKDLV